MPISKYQRKKIREKKEKALKLHKLGLTTREVGRVVDRSRTWVSNSVRELKKEFSTGEGVDSD